MIASSIVSSEAVTTTINSNEFKRLKVFSTHHHNAGLQKYATLETETTNKIMGCARGVFLNYEDNSEVFSTLLAAKLSSANLVIVAEKSLTSPWGDTDFCALTAIEIN